MMWLVTGGCGSIGSAIVRKLIEGGEEVRALDNNETGLYELGESVGSPRLRLLVGDVRDADRLRVAFGGVDVVIHAAALKHVSLCEYNAAEAVAVNVDGTRNVLLAAHEANVQRVVVVSTDKASEPVSAMGATKLLAEKLVHGMSRWLRASAVCVRFGNVWNSRGSVVPTILKRPVGEPIRITDPACTRYTMRMSEAVQFVLDVAGSKHEGCTVAREMVAYRLGDLVKAFSEFGGLEFSAEIVGLRPGERLHETLIGANEVHRRTADGLYLIGTERSGEPLPDGYRVTSEHAPKLTVDELVKMIAEVV